MTKAPEAFVRQIIVPDNAASVFVARVEMKKRGDGDAFRQHELFLKKLQVLWRQAWELAGRDTAPPLLVLEADIKLKALSDAELRDIGYMRIPMDKPA